MASLDDKNKFAVEIESLVLEKDLNYLDAIIYHCEKTGMEIETASGLINESLKKKIETVARQFNYLKKTPSSLKI